MRDLPISLLIFEHFYLKNKIAFVEPLEIIMLL